MGEAGWGKQRCADFPCSQRRPISSPSLLLGHPCPPNLTGMRSKIAPLVLSCTHFFLLNPTHFASWGLPDPSQSSIITAASSFSHLGVSRQWVQLFMRSAHSAQSGTEDGGFNCGGTLQHPVHGKCLLNWGFGLQPECIN